MTFIRSSAELIKNTSAVSPTTLPTVKDALDNLLSGQTASEILAKLQSLGSPVPGLDADTVDGLHVVASTYTPTLFNTANLSASTAYLSNYIQIGNQIIVSGKFDADATLAVTTTTLGVSIPVASVFATDALLNGVATAVTNPDNTARAYADTVNNRCSIEWVAQTTANVGFSFIFGYRVAT